MVEVYISKAPIYWYELCVLVAENNDRIFISDAKSKWLTRLSVGNAKVGNIWHINLDGPMFCFGSSSKMTPGEFVTYLEANYPADLEWLLWHPEVFSGRINLD